MLAFRLFACNFVLVAVQIKSFRPSNMQQRLSEICENVCMFSFFFIFTWIDRNSTKSIWGGFSLGNEKRQQWWVDGGQRSDWAGGFVVCCDAVVGGEMLSFPEVS